METNVYELNYWQDQYRTNKYWDKFYFYKLSSLHKKLADLLLEDGLDFNNIQPSLEEAQQFQNISIGQYEVEDPNDDEPTYFEITELEIN